LPVRKIGEAFSCAPGRAEYEALLTDFERLILKKRARLLKVIEET
jgi:hypothetical protein